VGCRFGLDTVAKRTVLAENQTKVPCRREYFCGTVQLFEIIGEDTWDKIMGSPIDRICVVILCSTRRQQGHAVAYLVEALCYKPEGRGFESR
jgi:hypothetical protein